MTARLLTILSLAAFAALGIATPAHAGTAPSYPTVSKISPLNLGIGDTMTITGRYFIPGKLKNTVVFKRDGNRAIFVKAATATSTRLTVVVPDKVKPWMAKSPAGEPVPTRFRIRILARRFAKLYSARSASPLIAPTSAAKPDQVVAPPAPPAPAPDCDQDGQPDAVDPDDDNDLMTDAFEASIKTNPCAPDTDADGLWDFWEYESALDLNLRALPFPGKRPYPNPLFADADVDYDGDGMRAWQEHEMWQRYGARSTTLNYSDGTQTSDLASGTTDDRRDVDDDGLANWWEANGPGQRDWWTKAYDKELPYEVAYASLDFLDPDSDGDLRKDGADDVDHDGWTNLDEMSRAVPFPGPDGNFPRWVNPYNPCLPNPESITCSLHPPIKSDDRWEPFKTLDFPVDGTYARPLRASLAP
jgi:hypothetical protein